MASKDGQSLRTDKAKLHSRNLEITRAASAPKVKTVEVERCHAKHLLGFGQFIKGRHLFCILQGMCVRPLVHLLWSV